MPRNVSGMRKLGRAFLKRRYDGTFTGDGVEHPMAIIALPGYMYPNRYWLSVRCMSTAENTKAHSQAELVISGRAGRIPGELGASYFENESDLRTIMERSSYHDQDSGTSVTSVTNEDVGISGGELRSKKGYPEWYRKDVNLGLPTNGILTGSQMIRYAYQDYTGQEYMKPGRNVDFKFPQVYTLGATYQTPVLASSDDDIEDAMFAGETHFDDVYRTIVEALPIPTGDGADPLVTDSTNELPADIQQWLSRGVSLSKDDDAYAEPIMAYTVKWTMEVMIGAPGNTTTISGA